MTNTTTNPYTPQVGYFEHHDYATTGFGITLDTLNYFLFANHLSLNPKAVSFIDDEQANQDSINEYLLEDANELLNANKLETEVFTAANADFVGFIIYDLPVIDKVKTQLTIGQAYQDIQAAINELYVIPNDLQDSLAALICEYANTINICDFN